MVINVQGDEPLLTGTLDDPQVDFVSLWDSSMKESAAGEGAPAQPVEKTPTPQAGD